MKLFGSIPAYIVPCFRCRNARWVCETHPHLAWELPEGCSCSAGAPCPDCNNDGARYPDGSEPVWTFPRT